MAEFGSTVLGVDVAELRGFSAAIVTATLGFAFLYLLGRPLKKLPILDVDPDYEPPRWVLPIFALGSAFLISVAFSSSIFLNVLQSTTSVSDFSQQYAVDVKFTKKPISKQITTAYIELDRYDGASTFQMFVNGYRLFSSEVNCMMRYQCRAPSETTKRDLESVNKIALDDRSLHNIHQLYELPYVEPFVYYLVPGLTYLDIISSNSGVGDCSLKVKVLVSAGEAQTAKIIDVLPDIGPAPDLDSDKIAFHAYGTNASASEPNRVDPYETMATDPSYRLCERIRIGLEIEPETGNRCKQLEAMGCFQGKPHLV